MNLSETGMKASIFSSAKIGVPQATVPNNGILTVYAFVAESSFNFVFCNPVT